MIWDAKAVKRISNCYLGTQTFWFEMSLPSVAVQPIGLLNQDSSALVLVLLEECEHLAEPGPSAYALCGGWSMSNPPLLLPGSR